MLAAVVVVVVVVLLSGQSLRKLDGEGPRFRGLPLESMDAEIVEAVPEVFEVIGDGKLEGAGEGAQQQGAVALLGRHRRQAVPVGRKRVPEYQHLSIV